MSDTVDLTSVPKEILDVAERAQKAGWDVQWTKTTPDAERPSLYISIPNGREERKQSIRLPRAERLLKVPFEQYRLLGGYAAINNSHENYIEAHVRVSGRSYPRLGLDDLPGVEIIGDAATYPSVAVDSDAVEEIAGPDTERQRALRAGAPWRLRVEDARHPWSIEFSEASDAFLALSVYPRFIEGGFRRRPITLKIRGINAPRHEEALQRLTDIGGAILFDLDLCYGTQLELSRYPGGSALVRFQEPEPIERPPTFPRLRYPLEALSLYWYGRSASGMPLLQFLAYYQVLEYFFPMYFRQQLLRRLRQELTDPRFNVTDDAQLARLLGMMTSSGRGGFGSERDQLKATIYGCIDEATLRSFLTEDAERLRVLGDKKAIKSVPVVVDDGHHGTLIDQVTERIYGIRCRVVHAKADGGDTAVDLLLPSSPEADTLNVDVSILQFLAQKAIVAGGTPFA